MTLGSTFKVTYLDRDGKPGEGVITGPKEATVDRVHRVMHLVGPNYGILPLTCSIRVIPERMSKGFLHQLYVRLDDGREAQLKGWYF